MRLFYVLAEDPNRSDLQSITKQQLDGLDLIPLWQGDPLEGAIPPNCRMFVTNKKRSDLLGNPLSLKIMSEHTLSIIQGYISQDNLQTFTLPVFNIETKEPILGYHLVNCLQKIAALTPECAAGPMIVSQLFIKESCIPASVHLFRLAERSLVLIMSEELFQGLSGNGLQGLMAIPAITVP